MGMAPATAPPPLLTNALEQAYFTSLADAANVLLVRTSVAGDFSPYELRLVNSATQAQLDPFEVTEVLTGFDPQLAAVQFSFKVECGPDFDCASATSRLPSDPAGAPADQLPRQGLRQLPHAHPGPLQPAPARVGRHQ